MVDQAHLKRIKQDVQQWNEWRRQNYGTIPYLRGADLRSADLKEVDLRDATLIGADLSHADLSHADLRGASLRDANLRDANLIGADLSHTDLRGADLRGANLIDADFKDAIIGMTSLGDRNFRDIKGLETLKYAGPSPLSINSIYQSEGNIPEVFVIGTGAPDSFIDYMHALTAKPIEYYTCFISYLSKDRKLAERVHADLQNKGIRCWFAPEDLKGGDKCANCIESSIRAYDKLLVLLSAQSIASPWMENEVRIALEKEERFKREQHQDRTVLFPLKLDAAIEEATPQWAAQLRQQRPILDFTKWTRHDSYVKAFERLLCNLKSQ